MDDTNVAGFQADKTPKTDGAKAKDNEVNIDLEEKINIDPKSVRYKILIVVSIIWFAFQLYSALIQPMHPMLTVPVHLLFGMTLTFLYRPLGEKDGKKWLGLIDLLLYAGIVYLFWYFFSQTMHLQSRAPYISKVYLIDKIAMLVLVITLLEAVRRVLGKILLIFIAIFIAYAWVGNYMPGTLKSLPTNLVKFTELLILSQEGIFGAPLNASTNYIFYFVIFGAIFASCGGGRLLIDLGLKVADKSAGGPAKAAVISSGLLGMVNGSSVANVATTGVMTIPMMKKVGYTPEQAGAIEAVASTGGQLMPPIMGVAAFIMAELMGVPYATVALAAIIPAIAYYTSVFCLVDNLAQKNHANKDKSVKFNVDAIMPRMYMLLPAFTLVYLIVSGASLMRAALISTAVILVINAANIFLHKGKHFFSWKSMGIQLINGLKQASEIAIPTGACGIIVGIVIQSGLATKFSAIIGILGESSILPALIVTMIGVMILGMALPTVAAYLVAYVLFCPVMLRLGIEPLAANMFIFYYGILAQVTPPVCLASFTAAGIAGGDSWKTGWTGLSFSFVAFLIPFVFVYNPSILLIGSTSSIIWDTIVLLLGAYFLAASVAGFKFVKLSVVERILFFVIASLLIIPETITDVIGLGVGFVIIVVLYLRAKKQKQVEK